MVSSGEALCRQGLEPPTFWPRLMHLKRKGRRRGLATRKPMLLFSLVGVLLFRFEERKLFSVLFQLPPRIERFSNMWARSPSLRI